MGAVQDRQGDQAELLQPPPQHREQRRPEDHDRPGSQVRPGSGDRRERRQGGQRQEDADGPAHLDEPPSRDESSSQRRVRIAGWVLIGRGVLLSFGHPGRSLVVVIGAAPPRAHARPNRRRR